MFYWGTLYHHHTLAGELEEIMQFIVPKAHNVATMNRCQTPGSPVNTVPTARLVLVAQHGQQMHKAVTNCKWCIQHGGTCTKSPMQPIIATASLEMLHIDFMSIEMTMELDQPPNVVNVLVFCDHFIKYVIAYVTPDQTVKTVAKFLWQWYISICGAPAKLLGDQGANFESNIFKELCELMGIQKVRTSSYHAQTNGQVDKLTNAYAHDRGSSVKTGSWIGLSIYQSWYMPATLWDWPSPDTAHTTWCSGTSLAHPLTFTSLW